MQRILWNNHICYVKEICVLLFEADKHCLQIKGVSCLSKWKLLKAMFELLLEKSLSQN